MKKTLPALFVAFASMFGGFALYQKMSAQSTDTDADVSPDFSLETLSGETFKLSDLRGKLVLVNFWATWCAPCLDEIPLLVEIQNRFASRGLQIVGPALDEPDRVRASLPRLKIQYPILIGEEQIPVVMDALGDRLGALPFSVLISPGGNVLARKHGEFDLEELSTLVEDNLPKI